MNEPKLAARQVTAINDEHIVVPYLHCKRTKLESVFSANGETPFCPHCGERLINPQTTSTDES